MSYNNADEEFEFSEENAVSLEDEPIVYEHNEPPKKPTFRTFPPAIRRSIEKFVVFLLIFNISAIFLFVSIGLNLYLFGLVAIVDLIVGGLAFAMYLSGKDDDIITFEGYVYNTLEHGIKGLNKSYTLVLYNEDTEKFLCIAYAKYIEPATPVTVYMSKSTSITMSDNGPMAESYLTVKFSKPLDDEALTEAMDNGNATISDYLEDNNEEE